MFDFGDLCSLKLLYELLDTILVLYIFKAYVLKTLHKLTNFDMKIKNYKIVFDLKSELFWYFILIEHGRL